MPLYKTITTPPQTRVSLWKIEESFAELSAGIELRAHCQDRIKSMKSDWHRRGFMSIRQLMALSHYGDGDLYYNENGKPYLKEAGKFISITHSHHFSAIIIADRPVGIDIEKQRSKILRIASKFTNLVEHHDLANEEALIRKLTVVWGAKEALYKLHGIPGLAFRKNIHVDDFNLDQQKVNAQVYLDGKKYNHRLKFWEFEGFTGVFTVE